MRLFFNAIFFFCKIFSMINSYCVWSTINYIIIFRNLASKTFSSKKQKQVKARESKLTSQFNVMVSAFFFLVSRYIHFYIFSLSCKFHVIMLFGLKNSATFVMRNLTIKLKTKEDNHLDFEQNLVLVVS